MHRVRSVSANCAFVGVHASCRLRFVIGPLAICRFAVVCNGASVRVRVFGFVRLWCNDLRTAGVSAIVARG